MARRTQIEFNTEIAKLRHNNKQFGRTSIIMSVLVITLAVVTGAFGYFTLKQGEVDLMSDQEWQQQQIDLIQKQLLTDQQIHETQTLLLEAIQDADKEGALD